MKISLNTIKFINQHYKSAGNPAPDGAEALAEKIGAQLGGIEEIIDIGSKYSGVVIVRIASCEKHPNADKLNICMIDDGGVTPELTRDGNGYIQVVCGAPNVREGLLVAWLPPGSTVPDSFGKEPFVLEARELRGVTSNGMLASARELAIGDSHDGILEIDAVGDESIKPGTRFSEAFGLDGDIVYDIENKMFTHRPDCFGFMGVAREIEGISQHPYKSPEWYRMDADLPGTEADELPLTVRNELPGEVKRFAMVAMSDVKVGPSPLWLQIELAKVGSRSINNIVDYTNYFMLLTGQPLHAYDYDKVKALDGGDAASIVVRNPKPGEKIKLLNGKEIESRAEAIMIATETALIGVGGVMGGADTEVDANTANIILEAANFDMYSIRRTSMAHGLFTDAVTRFNKGQSPLQNRAVMAKIVDEIRTSVGGKVASQLIDDNHLAPEILERGSLHAPVTVTSDFINARLGTSLAVEEMKALLTNVEFTVGVDGETLNVKAPFWRTDIEIPEDIVEEVGRLYGYDKLPLTLPRRSIAPAEKDALMGLKASIRSILSTAGANELLTYSFVHGKLLEKVGQDPEQAFKLSNALSPDLQYYRLSLTPSLLDKIHANIKAGYDEIALFEIGKGHAKGQFDEQEPTVPKEFNNMALVIAAADKHRKQGSPYFLAKHYLDTLAEKLGIELRYEALAEESDYQAAKPYDHTRSALVYIAGAERPIGLVGEFKPAVARALKLPAYTAGFEIGVAPELMGDDSTRYQNLSKYPKVDQDICFRVTNDISYQQLLDFTSSEIAAIAPENTYSTLSPVDIYQRPDDPDHKQITVRLSIASYDKTLRDSEVAALLDQIAATAHEKLGADRV
jgi:phenylalanyl-tRNA synthetase beta chain